MSSCMYYSGIGVSKTNFCQRSRMILNAMVQRFMLKSRISIIMQIYFSLAFQAKLICSIRNSKSMDM